MFIYENYSFFIPAGLLRYSTHSIRLVLYLIALLIIHPVCQFDPLIIWNSIITVIITAFIIYYAFSECTFHIL